LAAQVGEPHDLLFRCYDMRGWCGNRYGPAPVVGTHLDWRRFAAVAQDAKAGGEGVVYPEAKE
jgi:hypothetical protein